MKNKHHAVSQFRVRTDLAAGESLEACQRNLDYWTGQLEKYCYGKKGTRYSPGNAPYEETEIMPWQAADV